MIHTIILTIRSNQRSKREDGDKRGERERGRERGREGGGRERLHVNDQKSAHQYYNSARQQPTYRLAVPVAGIPSTVQREGPPPLH